MTPAAALPCDIAALRSFNRRYTRVLGLLNERLDGSAFSLTEARVLYELAQDDRRTAAEIGRLLGIDRGQLSRILKAFAAQGYVDGEISPDHARHRLLRLTPAGKAAFAALEGRTRDAVGRLLGGFDPHQRARVVALAREFEAVLATKPDSEVVYRAPRTGDIGWIVHRQALLYEQEFGWDWRYEALVAQILGDYVTHCDRAREDAWIAELSGEVVGSIFLKAGDEAGIARLRLLYVEPSARGRGIGAELVRLCVERARELGYSRLDLWTNSVLASARRIYEAAGFRLAEETPHHAFGHALIGQTWRLTL